ncbi:MAG: hypothetical protein U1F33_03895 [Alphaproteobacteria bacterium]
MAQLAAPEILRLPPPAMPRIAGDPARIGARPWQQAAARQAAADRQPTDLLTVDEAQSQLNDALPLAVDQWRPWRSLAFFAQSFAQQQPSTPATLDLRLYGHPAFAAYQAADSGFQRHSASTVDLAV